MSNAVEKMPVSEQRPLSPLDILDRAMEKGDLALVEQAMRMYERWEDREARKTFNRAITRAKAELPALVKTRTASFGTGKTAYRYDDLAEITRAVDPVLSRHGLHYRWRTINPPETAVTVTCVVSHDDGYSEENSLSGMPDTSGSKNPIQAIVSTVTYLQRATLKASLGLAAGQDTDAHSEKKTVSDERKIGEKQINALQQKIVATGTDIAAFCKHFEIGEIAYLPARRFYEAIGMLTQKATQ
jgi:hypothetical protein